MKSLQKEAEEIGSNMPCWKLGAELPVARFQNPGFSNGCDTGKKKETLASGESTGFLSVYCSLA